MREKPGFDVGCAFGVLVIMAMIGLLALAGGGTTNSNNRTETNVLSGNRILSPDTTIIVNYGDHNTIIDSQGQTLCADPNYPGQYNTAACAGKP